MIFVGSVMNSLKKLIGIVKRLFELFYEFWVFIVYYLYVNDLEIGKYSIVIMCYVWWKVFIILYFCKYKLVLIVSFNILYNFFIWINNNVFNKFYV